jgi:hypothetical protein
MLAAEIISGFISFRICRDQQISVLSPTPAKFITIPKRKNPQPDG